MDGWISTLLLLMFLILEVSTLSRVFLAGLVGTWEKTKSSFQIPGFSDLSLADFYYQLVSHWSIVLSDQAAVYGAG